MMNLTRDRDKFRAMASKYRIVGDGETELHIADSNETHLFPVVLFIHGESYSTGSGNAYDGSVMASFGRVIVVTMNYRLNVLGFLTTGDGGLSGNYGILDQAAALHWLADNIEPFGGDPQKITLLGHGTGAAMIHILLVSPVTSGRNFFHRVILQSGSAYSPSALKDPLNNNPLLNPAYQLVQALNCSAHWNVNQVLLQQCLQKIPYDQLLSMIPTNVSRFLEPFGPSVDHLSVLPFSISSMTNNFCQKSPPVSILAGVAAQEGYPYLRLEGLLGNENQKDKPKEAQDEENKDLDVIKTFVEDIFQYHQQKIFYILAHNYRDWERGQTGGSSSGLMEMIGDGLVTAPLLRLMQRLSNCSLDSSDTKSSQKSGKIKPSLEKNVYFYTFGGDEKVEKTGVKKEEQGYKGLANLEHILGLSGDDLQYIFGSPISAGLDPFPEVYSASDRRLSLQLLRYWTNFIKTGNPNDDGSEMSKILNSGKSQHHVTSLVLHRESMLDLVEWPTYNLDDQKYISFNIDRVPRVEHHYRSRQMALWNDLLPKIHKLDKQYGEDSTLDLQNTSHTDDQGPIENPKGSSKDTKRIPSKGKQKSKPDNPSLVALNRTNKAVSTQAGDAAGVRPDSTRVRPSASDEPMQPLHDEDFETKDAAKRNAVTLSSDAPIPVKSGWSESTLEMTVGVGCALFVLNVGVFLATYCQWRRENRRRQEAEHKLNTYIDNTASLKLNHTDSIVDRALNTCRGAVGPYLDHNSKDNLQDNLSNSHHDLDNDIQLLDFNVQDLTCDDNWSSPARSDLAQSNTTYTENKLLSRNVLNRVQEASPKKFETFRSNERPSSVAAYSSPSRSLQGAVSPDQRLANHSPAYVTIANHKRCKGSDFTTTLGTSEAENVTPLKDDRTSLDNCHSYSTSVI